MTRASKLRFAIQCGLAALIAFAGSTVLLKLGPASPLVTHPPGGAAGLGLLSYVVAALLILTGALFVFIAATELRAPDEC